MSASVSQLGGSTPTPTSPSPVAAAPAAAHTDGLDDSDILNDVFVESTWRGRAIKYDREQQADPVPTKEAAVQAKQRVTAGCQTDSASVSDLRADAPLPPAFGPFLKSVYPTLAAQLDANLESHAFDDYLVSWDEERDAFENVFQLQHSSAITELGKAPETTASSHKSSSKKKLGRSAYPPPSEEEHAAVLGVSWSCNGSVLVAAYGSSSHVGWCNHGAATLAFWNIMRRQISPTRPDFVLDQECCCMCVAYHPERPTILAGGMFNGEIRVWDTALLDDSADDDATTVGGAAPAPERNPLIMRSGIDDHFHREPIARLEWVRDSARAWQLVSVSGDGKILFWPMDDPTNKLSWPTDGYILSPSDKYSGQKLSTSSAAGRNRYAVLGGTAVAFAAQTSVSASDASASGEGTVSVSSSVSHSFLAATEGGGVLRLPLSSILKRKGFLKSGESRWQRDAYRLIEQSDPAGKFELKKSIEKYAKSIGVEAIDLETIFASHPNPAHLYPSSVDMTFEGHAGPVYGLATNRFDKNIFASASTDGKIKVFHMQNPKPLLVLEPGSEYLFSLVWSPSRPLVFAVCDSDGRLLVYDLLASLLAPSLVIPVTGGGGVRASIQSLSWNVSEPSLVACADMRGHVSVWNLSAKYAQVQPGEKRMLEQMSQMSRS